MVHTVRLSGGRDGSLGRILPDADASLTNVLIKKRIMSAEHKQSLSAVTTAAIGVVYGDIGTSPLYTLRVFLRPLRLRCSSDVVSASCR